ncbi:MAG TPA: (Fe-S)-binding protein [Rhodopila sp.]|uniref:(Fe-S)-binding protein n=1 Tax=Rhodopila sp. TaxID=2480087 RepID=UPI002CCF1410|nr:(Fe-S)-binding protein [Rhodopila sp.]HVY17448.1 (Fe-S)-binding protein [Rhodopila sp.]
MDAPTFETGLAAQTADILAHCVACGACAEVCPMPAPAGIATDPRSLTEGILTLLRGGAHADAQRWASVCSGSGHCIPACAHGVNPRLMLALARTADLSRQPVPARRQTGFSRFGAMTKGVRVLSRLQLPPETLARFHPAEAPAERPEVIFYTGCNVMKTPHIALLALDIMDALGVRYTVTGGPSACCGVLQFGAGDTATSGRVGGRTAARLAEAAPRALSWCPTCQIQIAEIAAPATGVDLNMAPFVRFLAERLDDLRPLMVHRVEKRVGLHEHPGNPGVPEAARAILEAIPGLAFVDLEQPRVGYMCNKLSPLPAFKADYHKAQLQAAEAAGVTTLAGIYHACHRELCSHERDWPFEVVNFLELLGESMGLSRPDLFKRLKVMQDVDAILADTAPMLGLNGVDLDEARDVILRDMLGEQPLPLGHG